MLKMECQLPSLNFEHAFEFYMLNLTIKVSSIFEDFESKKVCKDSLTKVLYNQVNELEWFVPEKMKIDYLKLIEKNITCNEYRIDVKVNKIAEELAENWIKTVVN